MNTMKITKPNTNRQIAIRYWDIQPREFIDYMKAGNSAKDYSWKLLSDNQSTRLAKDEIDGDSAPRNFALSIFENALDWRLGATVLQYINLYLKAQKLPKPFKLGVARNGDIYIVQSNGRVILA